MSKVLITGISGFIGQRLAQFLAHRGDEVLGLVRRTSRVDDLCGQGLRLVYGDVRDADSLRAATHGIDAVYHLAGCTRARHVEDFYQINSAGTYNVAAACAAQSRPPVLIVVSSLAAAGPSEGPRPRVESDPLRPVSHYGRSKRRAELAAASFADRVPTTIVRPPIVFGPGDTSTLPMFQGVARTHIHLCPCLVRYHYSLIDARDLARLLVLAADRGARLTPANGRSRCRSQGSYFVACERDVSYAELGRLISRGLGHRRVLTIPTASPIIWAISAIGEIVSRFSGRATPMNLDKYREVSAGSWACSPRAAVEELGFAIEIPLAERIRQAVAWYRERGRL